MPLSDETAAEIRRLTEECRAHLDAAERIVAGLAKQTANDIMDAQADLQVGLGFLRLYMRALDEGYATSSQDDASMLNEVEERLSSSLAKMHGALGSLGRPMP